MDWKERADRFGSYRFIGEKLFTADISDGNEKIWALQNLETGQWSWEVVKFRFPNDHCVLEVLADPVWLYTVLDCNPCIPMKSSTLKRIVRRYRHLSEWSEMAVGIILREVGRYYTMRDYFYYVDRKILNWETILDGLTNLPSWKI